MLYIHLARTQPFHGPAASLAAPPTRQGEEIQELATQTRDAYLRPKSDCVLSAQEVGQHSKHQVDD